MEWRPLLGTPEFPIERKEFQGITSQVTGIDKAANVMLKQRLAPLSIPIVSEEDTHRVVHRGEEVYACEAVWREHGNDLCLHIDPVDGTGGLISDKDFALLVGGTEKGKPKFGAAYFPTIEALGPDGRMHKGVLYFTNDEGTQAYKQVGENPPQRLHHLQPELQVAAQEEYEKELAHRAACPQVAVGYSHQRNHGDEVLARLLPHSTPCAIVPAISAYRICQVADGQADICVSTEPSSTWDMAGPHAILNAVGGHLLAMPGGPETLGQRPKGERFAELTYGPKAIVDGITMANPPCVGGAADLLSAMGIVPTDRALSLERKSLSKQAGSGRAA